MQAGHLGPHIYVGTYKTGGHAFTRKQERTDMVLAAVAQYVERHFDGGMRADFPGLGVVVDIKVQPLASEGGAA